jgi:signal transduction histidine kinase
MLDDLGLMPTLRWHVDRYHRQTEVHVSLDIAEMEDRRFAAEVETAAYRIVQEALTNVARHARVSQAIVRLWADENALHVYVEDRGIGFDPDVVEGTGLVGMRERAAALDGLLSIRASPGASVSVAATLPLHAPA